MITDKYRKARGGYSRLLQLSCESCGANICKYQKDGPGILKRLYFDRVDGLTRFEESLSCLDCGQQLGVKITYQKEKRLAYRLFTGAVRKKIIKKSA